MNRLNLFEGVEIDGIKINDKIFNEELTDWNVEDLDTFIDLLIDWIGECERDREGDEDLMKEDLIMMMNRVNIEDNQTFFKSILTNEYLFSGDDGFDEVCDEILKLNKEMENGK